MDPSEYVSLLVARPLEESDLPYVAKTWARTRPTWSRGMTRETWQGLCTGRIERVVRRLGGEALTDPGRPDWILGFRVSAPGRLWFLYVKASQRGLGLGRRLLTADRWLETPWPTRDGQRMREFPSSVNILPFFEA